MKFISESVPGIAGSRSQGAAALNHEFRNHAMEDEAVIKSALHFFPRARIGEFLGAFGEADKIFDRLRSFFFKQTGHNRSLRSFNYSVRARCAAQEFLLN